MLRTEFLATLRIELKASHVLGETPAGWRRIDVFAGGSLQGPKINGRLIHGSDQLLRRADGSMQPDVRIIIETDDNAIVTITYRGVRHGSPEVMEKIAQGIPVAPDEYYLRCAPFFETGSARYDWLNRIVSVGVGRREPAAAVYDIYEVL